MLKLAALASAFLLVPSAAAIAQSKTVTVPGTVVFEHGENPNDPGNCSAAVFVQWSHDPTLNVVSARAIVANPAGEASKSKAAPFDDTYDWVRIYTAPPGTHRIVMGVSWGDGPVVPNDCGETNARHMAQWPTREASIELTVDVTAACSAAQKKASAAAKQLRIARARVSQAPPSAQRRERRKLQSALAAKRRADKAVRAAC